MAETPGQRLYMIRLACGDGVRDPEPLDDFSARVYRVTRESYPAMKLSLLERDQQKWKVRDAEVLSRVDPLERGRSWLAFGDRSEEITVAERSAQSHPPAKKGSGRPVPDRRGKDQRKHGNG